METENNINNGVTPNQQPQPQKEEEKKKKNKFVAWWLGLNKWAKVGICAGTAAVLATAITLPLVLNKTVTINVSSETSDVINIKKGTMYSFKYSINDDKMISFFTIQDEETLDNVPLTYGKVYDNNGKDLQWTFFDNNKQLVPPEGTGGIKCPNTFKINIKVSRDVPKARAHINAGS